MKEMKDSDVTFNERQAMTKRSSNIFKYTLQCIKRQYFCAKLITLETSKVTTKN